MTLIDVNRAQASLAASIDVVRSVLEDGRIDAAVAACPGWDLGELVRHLGSVHRWATQVVVTGVLPDHARTNEGPGDRAALIPWFAEGAAALQRALADVDPQRPTWTFGPPETAAFWSRRQAQETLVHAWDACASQGADMPIPADMAADGLDEIATVMFPRQVRLERISPLEVSVAFTPTDADGGIVLAGDGLGSPASVDATVDATVRGRAADLLLLLWGRGSIDGLAIEGSASAVETVLATAVVP